MTNVRILIRAREATMAKSFYVTLPSNGSTGVFPDNTVTEYRNKLAKPIYFEGDWEVGMLECSYPHSWWQICHENSGFSFVNRSEATVNSDSPIPWEGSRFSNIESIQNVTPTILKERLFLTYREGQDLIEFSDPLPNYDDRVEVKAKEGYLIEFRGKLCRTLGFPDPTLVADTWERAPYPWTSENIDHIFFYTDIITPQRVGDVEVPLLKQVPVDNDSYPRPVNVTFPVISYYPVNKNPIETIEIVLRDGTGNKIPFTSGRTIVTLHFRRKEE